MAACWGQSKISPGQCARMELARGFQTAHRRYTDGADGAGLSAVVPNRMPRVAGGSSDTFR